MSNEQAKPPRGRLGADSLISAAVAVRKDDDRENEFARHRRLRYDLLREQLGVDWDLLDARAARRHFPTDLSGLPGLIEKTIALLAQATSPFGSYLEAPRAIIEAYERHRQEIGRAGKALREAQRSIALDLFAILEPEASTRTTSTQRLREAGLPDDPAPFGEDV